MLMLERHSLKPVLNIVDRSASADKRTFATGIKHPLVHFVKP